MRGKWGEPNIFMVAAAVAATSCYTNTSRDTQGFDPPASTGDGEVDTDDASTSSRPPGTEEGAAPDGTTGASTSGMESSGGDVLEAIACDAIIERWIDLGDARFEVDFDGGGERPASTFRCREPTAGSVELELEGEGWNVDLATIVGDVEIDQLVLFVGADAAIGSLSVNEPALTSGALGPGIELSIISAGRIQGAGGAGGYGGVCGVASTPGDHGGVALELLVGAYIGLQVESDGAEAVGMLWGGGGGGGGGGDGCDEIWCGGTGGGGGGAGLRAGAGGDARDPATLPSLDGTGTCADAGGANPAGQDGTADAGGNASNFGRGGGPGLPGSAGHPGKASFQTTVGQPGGLPGCALTIGKGVVVTIDGGDVRPAAKKSCHAGQ